MPFKKGDPKPPKSGIKKGQKHERTMAQEACEKLKINPFEVLAQGCLSEDETTRIGAAKDLCKYLQAQMKSMDVAIDPEKNKIEIIIRRWGE